MGRDRRRPPRRLSYVPPLDELVARARGLGEGALLGLTGPPGAGKSTLAGVLATALGAAVVPMDGFHLASGELHRLGLVDRKGAPDTFDAAGYVALLRRLRGRSETVYAPEFRRELEEPVAGAVAVSPGSFVVTEGNYLLLDSEPWAAVRGLLDEVWYVDPGDSVRLSWLVERHVAYGRPVVEARARATAGSDGANARLVAATRSVADLVVRPSPDA